jgi:hypothetical protein
METTARTTKAKRKMTQRERHSRQGSDEGRCRKKKKIVTCTSTYTVSTDVY